MPDEPKKFAEVQYNPETERHTLVVGGCIVYASPACHGPGGIDDDAAEINAAFEAEVERRLAEFLNFLNNGF